MHQVLISFPFFSFSFYHDTHPCLLLFYTEVRLLQGLSECTRPTFHNTVCSFVLSHLLSLSDLEYRRLHTRMLDSRFPSCDSIRKLR
jgi:hypothetical protein